MRMTQHLYPSKSISITHQQTLENVKSPKYHENMDCSLHIPDISAKTIYSLGFLCRNLALAPKSTKEVAYKTLVHPKLEYAAPIWCPYRRAQIQKVQRTAAGM